MPSTELQRYRARRSAGVTPEPFGAVTVPRTGRLFVVQQHRARHLHWDFRLEIDGVLRSWAVPKGPSVDMRDKRFAVLTEDHPLDYAQFEGRIPEGNYGAGVVLLWDRGTFTALNDFKEGFKSGKLLFELAGFKLHGRWTLVRTRERGKSDDGNNWLLIKERDQWEGGEVVCPESSVLSGMTLEELARPAVKTQRIRRAARAARGSKRAAGLVSATPMLATAGEAFDRPGWLFELKYDGYRVLIERDGNRVSLRSRNGQDLTAGFPEIVLSAESLPLERFVLDGELTVSNDAGVPDFALLQQRAALGDAAAVSRASVLRSCTYYAFDVLQLGDRDLREVPLATRKRLLAGLVPACGYLRYSEHVVRRGLDTYRSAVAMGLEGVVAKRADSAYAAGRSSDWVKVRRERTGDFVITGWRPSRADPSDIGALTLGEYRNGELKPVGAVGSGLNTEMRRKLREAFAAIPGACAPEGADRADDVHWLEPTLVCEVAYREYTPGGKLRQPVFRRLRHDKLPHECTGHFDAPHAVRLAPAPPPQVSVTNPDKLLFPEAGLAKSDLVRYYRQISPWMLHYLADRPLVLTRYPDGIHGKSFFQRDAPEFVPDWIRREVLWSESAEREVHYFIVDSAAALEYLANLGAVVIHAWHSRVGRLDRPDWCVMDLDPKDAPFSDVVELAREIHALCEELELPAYVKTSGASGLHVLIPLGGQLSHDHSRTLAELLARVVVDRQPGIATIARSVRARRGRVYLDYLQNGHGKLLVAPFSVRAEVAGSVSMPLKWTEVNGRLGNERYHLQNAVRRMRRLAADPLINVLTDEPDLPRALARLQQVVGGPRG